MADQSSPPPYRTRLWVLFASDAPKAVILRRGPKTHFQLIEWDMRKNRFTPGQWMKGHIELCDLSPDGDKLIYCAHQYHMSAPRHLWPRNDAPVRSAGKPYEPLAPRPRNRSPKKGEKRRRIPRYMQEEVVERRPTRIRLNEGRWTAVSTPPYFTALAIWPTFGHWTGGGFFASEREIILNEDESGMTAQENVPLPSWMRVRSFFKTSQFTRMSAWTPYMADPAIVDPIAAALKDAGAEWVEWIAPGEGGQLYFACDGCVFRLREWEKTAPAEYLQHAEQLADFTGNRFTLVRAPAEAMRW